MNGQEDPKPWDEADEYALGGSLTSEVLGYIGRGEAPPDELRNALATFQERAWAMAHVSDPERSGAWYSLWTSIEGGLKDATTLATIRQARESTDEDFRYEAFNRPGMAEAQMRATHAPPWAAPEAHEKMRGRKFELSPEAIRNAAIQANPSYKDVEGREVVADQDGIIWDLSEALAVLRDPKMKKAIELSLQGLPEVAKEAPITTAFPTVVAGMRGVAKAREFFGAQPIVNVRTAQPGLVLPWLPSEELADKLQDPVWTRALRQVMAEMERSGEMKQGTVETFARAAAGLVDFMLFSKGMSAAGKMAGTAALKAGLSKTTLPGALAGKMAAGRAATTFPLNTHFGRLSGDFMAYEVGTKAFDDRTMIPEDIWHGFQSAAVFAGAGVIAKAARGLAQKAAVSHLAHKAAPILKGAVPPSMQGFDRLYEAVRKFPKETLTKTVERLEAAPHIKQAIKGAVDAYQTGAYVHAYNEAQGADPGKGFETFWRSLLSGPANATGLAFALGAGIQASFETRKQVNAFMQSEAGKKTLRSVAERMASPRAEEAHREVWKQMDTWREKEPQLFEGLVKRTARGQEIVRERARAKQVATAITGFHPEEGPGFDPSVPVTGPRLNSSALEKFREAERISEATMAAEGAKAQRPEYKLGSIAEQTLKDIGFNGYNHAKNTVHQFLRKVEGNGEERYVKLEEVPRALWLRVLAWRDRQQVFEGELRGEAVPSMVDVLRQREVPAEERQPEQKLLTSKAGEQLPEQGALSSKPPLLGEAAEVFAEIEGHPLYRAMSPLEAVAKAKSMPKRSSLGRDMKLVTTGKRSVEWLKETYPEGAAAIGKGKPEEWIGAFGRAVQANWKEKLATRARAQVGRMREGLAKYREGKETIQSWFAREGGLKYMEDLNDLAEQGIGKARPVVQPKGSPKGMPIDQATEAAWEEGFFPERPTIKEFMDALNENVPHPGSVWHRTRMAEEERAHVSQEQVEVERGQIEAGTLELPTDIDARRKALVELYAGDKRFVGLTPERLEREILQMRLERQQGAPEAMLAGPMPEAGDFARQAAAGLRRLTDDLRALDVLSMDATAQSQEAIHAVMELVRGKAPTGVPAKRAQEYIERARTIRFHHREALRRMLDEAKSPGQWKENLNALWDAIDAEAFGDAIPEAARDILAKLGWLDEFGRVSKAMEAKAQQAHSEFLWEHIRKQEAAEGEMGFYSGLPIPLAFSGRKFTRVEETGIAAGMSWQKLYEAPWFRRAMKSKVNRRLFKLFADIGALPGLNFISAGPLSRPQAEGVKTANRLAMLYRSIAGSKSRELEMRMAGAVTETFAAFGGRRMPSDHSEFYDWGHKSGFFKNARGPADFERAKPGTGYLWSVYTKQRDIFEEVAKEAMALGVMSQEQYDAWGQGKYLTQTHIREQMESDAAALGRGEIPLLGRSMLRERGEPDQTEAIFRVLDAPIQMMKGIGDWARVLRVVGTWWHPLELELMRTEAEVARMTPMEREDYTRAGVRIKESGGRSLEQELVEMGRSGEWDPATLTLSYRLEVIERSMAKEGEPPAPGQIAYSPRLKKLTTAYLDSSMYLPKPLMWELDIGSSELFSEPGDSAMARFAHKVDLFGAFSKRGLVALRPSAMAMDYLSSAINNHVGRAVPLWDFMAGHMGLPSFTKDGLQGGLLYGRWVKEGAPQKKPESWSDKDWRDAQEAKRYMEAAGHSSSVFAVIGPEIATITGAFADNPYSMRESLMAQMERHARANDWSLSQKDRLEAAIVGASKRTARGLERVDMKIAEWMGDADPAAHAKAVAMYAAYRTLAEVFIFKYPAFLKAKHEWPDQPYSALIEYSTQKTSNYADTSPSLRRWLSLTTPWNDKVWQAAQGAWKIPGTAKEIGKAVPKMIASQLMRHRFYSYPATMVPQFLRWSVTNPIGMGLATAAMASLSGLVWSLYGDDERAAKLEEIESSKGGAARWIAMTEREEEAMERYLRGMSLGPLSGRTNLPQWLVKRSREFWSMLPFVNADPNVIPMPEHGGQSRTSSLGELTPAGYVKGRVKGVENLISAVAGAGEGRKAEAAQGLERLYGVSAQALIGTAAGVLTGDDPIVEALGGKRSLIDAFGTKIAGLIGRAGLIYPKGLGMFTPEGIFIGENVAFGGQGWREVASKIVRARDLQSPTQALASSALRSVWPSRAVYQKPPLREPADAWTALLSELWGPGFDPSTAEGRARIAAGRWVNAQMGVLMGDLYRIHREAASDPAQAEVTLDERVIGALQETFSNTQRMPTPDGERYMIQPGYKPKGALLRAIAGMSPLEQSTALDYLMRWTSRETFWEDGRRWLMEAGNARNIAEPLFREGMMRALSDPSGTSLLGWWRSEVEKGDEDRMGQLAPLIHDVSMPHPSSRGAFEDWTYILAEYARKGLDLPPLPKDGQLSVDALLKDRGHAEILQGGRAFENTLLRRQGAEIEELLAPR